MYTYNTRKPCPLLCVFRNYARGSCAPIPSSCTYIIYMCHYLYTYLYVHIHVHAYMFYVYVIYEYTSTRIQYTESVHITCASQIWVGLHGLIIHVYLCIYTYVHVFLWIYTCIHTYVYTYNTQKVCALLLRTKAE